MLQRSILVSVVILTWAYVSRSGERNDGASIDGVWVPEAAELAGKTFPEDVRKMIRLAVQNGKYRVTVGDQVDEGAIKLNPTAKPKELDITGTDGPNKGRTILAIYELERDTLRICYDLSGKDRPTEFRTREGTALFLVNYRRAKN